jgi:hypothetical protein
MAAAFQALLPILEKVVSSFLLAPVYKWAAIILAIILVFTIIHYHKANA